MFHAGCASLFERRASAEAGGARGGCSRKIYATRQAAHERDIIFYCALHTHCTSRLSRTQTFEREAEITRAHNTAVCGSFVQEMYLCARLVLSFKFALMEIHEKYKTQSRSRGKDFSLCLLRTRNGDSRELVII